MEPSYAVDIQAVAIHVFPAGDKDHVKFFWAEKAVALDGAAAFLQLS